MQLFFVIFLYLLSSVLSLHVSGFYQPIIRGIFSRCVYAATWFMQCYVVFLPLSASAVWFTVVTTVSNYPDFLHIRVECRPN